MIWLVTILTFVVTLAVLLLLLVTLLPEQVDVAGRLSRMLGGAVPVDESTFVDKQKQKMANTIAGLGKILPAPSTQGMSRDKLLIVRAGFRDPDTIMVIRGFKLILPIGLLAAVYFSGIYRANPAFLIPLSLFGGFFLPDLILTWLVRRRQHQIRRALPDALDLLVICVEAGLGLDQGILKVAQELRITHPVFCAELQLVNLEMRVGKTRIEALHELGRRTGLEDIKTLVAMLVQTERFGTSIAQSLRVYADDMRTRRRQRAEEMSAKTSVKMVPPLVFFIFPALMVVILGPAVLTIMKQLLGK
jgi:tight adherence protein C